jgi:threonine dehydrogenase-like Zn-dependent dehydrogenase
MAEPLACCLNGLEKVELKRDETVVILGAGPIGCLCAMASKHLGAGKVILVERDPSRRTLSQQATADTVLDSTEVDVVEAVNGRYGIGLDRSGCGRSCEGTDQR